VGSVNDPSAATKLAVITVVVRIPADAEAEYIGVRAIDTRSGGYIEGDDILSYTGQEADPYA